MKIFVAQLLPSVMSKHSSHTGSRASYPHHRMSCGSCYPSYSSARGPVSADSLAGYLAYISVSPIYPAPVSAWKVVVVVRESRRKCFGKQRRRAKVCLAVLARYTFRSSRLSMRRVIPRSPLRGLGRGCRSNARGRAVDVSCVCMETFHIGRTGFGWP